MSEYMLLDGVTDGKMDRCIRCRMLHRLLDGIKFRNEKATWDLYGVNSFPNLTRKEAFDVYEELREDYQGWRGAIRARGYEVT